jgi:hypothetical protein
MRFFEKACCRYSVAKKDKKKKQFADIAALFKTGAIDTVTTDAASARRLPQKGPVAHRPFCLCDNMICSLEVQVPIKPESQNVVVELPAMRTPLTAESPERLEPWGV